MPPPESRGEDAASQEGSEKHGHALRQKFLLPEIAYTFELTIERLQKMETEKRIEALRSMPLRKL